MIFEVQDLVVASPATVSRCGMVYVEPGQMGWRPLRDSWMQAELPSALTQAQRDHVGFCHDPAILSLPLQTHIGMPPDVLLLAGCSVHCSK